MKDGKEKAGKLRIDSAIGLNEFYSDRNGKEELVTTKRNEGGFVHVCETLNEDEKTRNTFECDMIISNCSRIEGDAEKGIPEKVIVKGVNVRTMHVKARRHGQESGIIKKEALLFEMLLF